MTEDARLSICDTPSGRKLKLAMALSDAEGITIGEALARVEAWDEDPLRLTLEIVAGADRFVPVPGDTFTLCEDEDGTEIKAKVLTRSDEEA